jgi:hypothetical protein
MWGKITEAQGAVIAALITGMFVCIAAVVGLGYPIVDKWTERQFDNTSLTIEPTRTATTNEPETPTINAPSDPSPTLTQQEPLLQNEPVSPETLARVVGGDATHWKQESSVVWVYSNKDHNTLIQHPGDNMIVTYWAGFGDPQNSYGCQIIISPANSSEKYVKCSSGTNAQIVADQVGLHLIDYTGYFP